MTPTDLRRYRSHNFGQIRFFVGPVVIFQKMSAANLYLSVGRRYGEKGVLTNVMKFDDFYCTYSYGSILLKIYIHVPFGHMDHWGTLLCAFHIGPDPPPRGAGGADLFILIFFFKF